MKKANTLGSLALFAAWCAVPASVLAAPCGGTNINHTVTWSPTEIVKGVQLSILRSTTVIVSNDPSAPFHLASGECTGAIVLVDGKAKSGSGHCARKDKDGDVIFEDWVLTEPGKGTSKVPGGTGKFANASWTYSWQVRSLHAPTAAVSWTGDCR